MVFASDNGGCVTHLVDLLPPFTLIATPTLPIVPLSLILTLTPILTLILPLIALLPRQQAPGCEGGSSNFPLRGEKVSLIFLVLPTLCPPTHSLTPPPTTNALTHSLTLPHTHRAPSTKAVCGQWRSYIAPIPFICRQKLVMTVIILGVGRVRELKAGE